MKVLSSLLSALTLVHSVASGTTSSSPNFVLFVADDLGYGDLGCYGNTTLRTPNIDRLAADGVKLTHNLAAESVCTPSRTAFLTGRYPIRSGMAASHALRAILFTASNMALPANETTFAEVAKSAGYTNAFLGKWHLGWSVDRSDPQHTHPLNQGFDYFYGVPFSNAPDFGDPRDTLLRHLMPDVPYQLGATFVLLVVSVAWLVRIRFVSCCLGVSLIAVTGLLCGVPYFILNNLKLLNSFFFRNYELVEQPIHLPSVTAKLVVESQQFLQARHADAASFLLVVSWLHVKAPAITAARFRGRSQHGQYGDAVEEMDWGVGQILETLDQLGLANNTLVYFASDHGGSLLETDWMGRPVGGYNGPFKGGKTESAAEGAIRVPGIIRWPGKVAAGHVIHEPVSLMDILPTIASLLNVPLPSGVTLDGKNQMPLLTGRTSLSPHEFLFHYCGDRVHAVRYRPPTGSSAVWKLVLKTRNYTSGAAASPYFRCQDAIHLDPPHLYDMTTDPGEIRPLDLDIWQHREVVSAMMAALGRHETSIAHVPSQFSLVSMLPCPWKQPCCNFPRCACEDDKFKGMFDDL